MNIQLGYTAAVFWDLIAVNVPSHHIVDDALVAIKNRQFARCRGNRHFISGEEIERFPDDAAFKVHQKGRDVFIAARPVAWIQTGVAVKGRYFLDLTKEKASKKKKDRISYKMKKCKL